MLNSSEDAHVKAMSAFETDEHLREQVCVAAEVARLHSMSEGAPGLAARGDTMRSALAIRSLSMMDRNQKCFA